jgi:23S rRNA (adenine2503-C2)-methyltransferase
MTRDILSMSINELCNLMSELCQPAYRAEQIFEWLHRRGAAFFDTPFAQMDNLPAALREALAEACYITPCREVKRQTSKDGTVKFLFAINPGPAGESGERDSAPVFIESVLMEYNHGQTVCISTQAGCRMGCAFCASAVGGLVRNLTAGEMCAQVYAMQRETPRISSVVLMGCGEPLDNFNAVLRFIELITHKKGAHIGARHITLSTCGLVPQIRELAERKLQINLALSLHGASDEIRKQYMPVANRYPLGELLDVCRYYIALTRRRVTFEYTLIKGINDTTAQAKKLAALLKGVLCHVNLIPLNATSAQFGPKLTSPTSCQIDTKFSPTPRREAQAFAETLTQNGIPATIRRSLGSDIAGACGQLRSNFPMEGQACEGGL